MNFGRSLFDGLSEATLQNKADNGHVSKTMLFTDLFTNWRRSPLKALFTQERNQRHRIHCRIKKRSEISPFELIDNRFARIHGRLVLRGGGRRKHILAYIVNFYCNSLFAFWCCNQLNGCCG